jgi:hypothetical protein
VIEAGLDFAVVGRSAIVHHDFPDRIAADPEFSQMALPVTPEYLGGEGVAAPFIGYLSTMQNFVVGGAQAVA